jgi:hypothetical protein
MMKYKFVVPALLATFQACGAAAQVTITPPPHSSAFGVDPIIRITTGFRAALAGSDPQSVPDAAMQEAARRAIYTMAMKECAVLSESFKAECRLGSVTTYTGATAPNPAAPPGHMTGTATYELKPRAAGPAQ